MRILGYVWAFPVTLLGLSFAMLAVVTGGVLEAWGGAVAAFLRGSRFHRGGAAMTLGHVVLARDLNCLEQSRSHEMMHVRQFERWGLLLLPVYWCVACWLWCRGYHPYLDHPLEPPVKNI